MVVREVHHRYRRRRDLSFRNKQRLQGERGERKNGIRVRREWEREWWEWMGWVLLNTSTWLIMALADSCLCFPTLYLSLFLLWSVCVGDLSIGCDRLCKEIDRKGLGCGLYICYRISSIN